MNSGQLDAEILYLKQMRDGTANDWKLDDDIRDERVAEFTAKINFLKEMKQLRARYGSGYVYQNALKGTDFYQGIQHQNQRADLYRRDVENPMLRDFEAEYAELGCAAFLAGRR
jgi:hypothetical protein